MILILLLLFVFITFAIGALIDAKCTGLYIAIMKALLVPWLILYFLLSMLMDIFKVILLKFTEYILKKER